MTAEERELMEEAEAIKAAQETAKEIFGFPQEETKKQVNKAQEQVAAPSNGVSGPPEQKGPRRRAWRAGWRVQACRGSGPDRLRPCALLRAHLLACVRCERWDPAGSSGIQDHGRGMASAWHIKCYYNLSRVSG